MVDRQFIEDTLVIATHNTGKMEEFKALFADFNFTVLSAAMLGIPEPEETEISFIGNAILKAKAAAFASGKAALADDSGLSVAALDGAPGIYSARWAGLNRDFTLAMGAVERALEKINCHDTQADFICALALVWPDGHAISVKGKVQGKLIFPPRGKKGFGYDPIFQPNGHTVSFGQMEPETKHNISHRADAFAQLITRCFSFSNDY
ncbi:RdgB/HAM1 family non-canonical purine NTP pyrophosphatase [Candidatus Puniceispirillum sp.]|nr:RdgB/HAM1 family non-canonical purine NTP pyrophosphatase [Candidatus Puniceispirillum sp.]